MIAAIEEHEFYRKWTPAPGSVAYRKLEELLEAITTWQRMSEKTAQYSREMGIIRGRLAVITADSDPEQLALDQPRIAAYGAVWDVCYRLESEAETKRRKLESELAGFDVELTNRRNRIDHMAELARKGDAADHHVAAAKDAFGFACRDMLRRQPGDFI